MSAPLNTLLDEALELWQGVRDGVIAEAETVPADQFDWRPTPQSRTVSELILHIAEFSLLAAGELTRRDGDFQRASYTDFLNEYTSALHGLRGKDQLIQALRETYRQAEGAFRAAGEVALLQRIRRFDGLSSTRLAWMYHAIEHESYHRGQLALYVRMLGRVPALTRAMLGEA